VAVEADEGGGAVSEGDGEREAERSASGTRRRRRQMTRRSALLAKQVISVSSARSLGFVSQLWVHAASVRTDCCSLHLFFFSGLVELRAAVVRTWTLLLWAVHGR
jgi:hypothetical protein